MCNLSGSHVSAFKPQRSERVPLAKRRGAPLFILSYSACTRSNLVEVKSGRNAPPSCHKLGFAVFTTPLRSAPSPLLFQNVRQPTPVSISVFLYVKSLRISTPMRKIRSRKVVIHTFPALDNACRGCSDRTTEAGPSVCSTYPRRRVRHPNMSGDLRWLGSSARQVRARVTPAQLLRCRLTG